MSRFQDLLAVLRGLQTVAEAAAKLQQEQACTIWNNSSVNELLKQCPKRVRSASNFDASKASTGNASAFSVLADTADRLSTVVSGVQEYVNYSPERYKQIRGKLVTLDLINTRMV